MPEDPAERVRAALEAWARPVLQADGGDVELVSVDDGVVTVRLRAACAGCPGSAYTLAAVVRPAIASALDGPFEIRILRAPTLPGARATA